MTSKLRGLAPFLKKETDRFPMWFGGAPQTIGNIVDYLGATSEHEALYDIIGIDYMTIRPRYTGKPFEVNSDGTTVNEWGIKRGGYYWGQPLTHPLENAKSISDIEAYSFPDPDDWDVQITNDDLLLSKDHCIIGGTWAPFFHDSLELMGMENFLMRMYDDSKLVDALIEKCFEFYYELNVRSFKVNPGKIDLYFTGNDFGSQQSLIVSPQMWRRYYKKRLAKLADLAHQNGAFAAIHSCGDIHEIIPDLIEAGYDAINPIQTTASNMDPVILEREYGKDIVFFGGIDEKELLRSRTESEVREETKRIIEILGKNGRYIVAPSHDYLLPDIPAGNIVAMYDEAKKYGNGK